MESADKKMKVSERGGVRS